MADGKVHDKRLSAMMIELANQMVDPSDTSPGSETLSRAVMNMFCALSTMSFMHEHIDPVIILGSLELAKSHILHSYHEAMTIDKMNNGE